MAVYIIGDIHGQLDKLLGVLTRYKLIENRQRWIGGTSQLWFMGDFFDRGPSGVGVVELIIELQQQAADAGGAVRAIMGNHEVLFLSAHRFQNIKKFRMSWKRNGGQESDMALVSPQQLAWLRSLPAMAHVEDRLLIHADAVFYRHYGTTEAQVNQAIQAVVHSDDPEDWELLLEDFAERMAFAPNRSRGLSNVADMLQGYGGRQIVHGHTPIQYLTDLVAPIAPLIYMQNLCVNVDGGMYLGGPGFAHLLPDLDEPT